MQDAVIPLLKIIRMNKMKECSGYSRSGIYQKISVGLWPKPVSLGPRAVGWVESEIQSVLAARVAGKSEEQIRALIATLTANRRTYEEEASL